MAHVPSNSEASQKTFYSFLDNLLSLLPPELPLNLPTVGPVSFNRRETPCGLAAAALHLAEATQFWHKGFMFGPIALRATPTKLQGRARHHGRRRFTTDSIGCAQHLCWQRPPHVRGMCKGSRAMHLCLWLAFCCFRKESCQSERHRYPHASAGALLADPHDRRGSEGLPLRIHMGEP